MPYYNKQRCNWTAQVQYEGIIYRTTHQTKLDAVIWERKKRKELISPPKPLPVPELKISTPSLYDFATMYLDHAKNRHSQKTYNEKRLAFRCLFKVFSPRTAVDQLHKGMMLDYFTKQARARSGNAANKDRKNLVAAWNWASRYIPSFPQKNPFLVDRCAEERHPRYVPPESDFWAIYAAAESEQDRLMLLAYLHLAARKMELFRLQRSDVDLDRNQIRLATRKRKDGSMHYDWLPMTPTLSDAMLRHLASLSGDWVFPDPQTGEPYSARQHWLPRLCRKAGVKEFGLHGIRHLSASILMANKVSLVDIQTVLRHMNLTTTQRYVHRLEDVRGTLKAVFC